MWLCFALAAADILLIAFLFPESNFSRSTESDISVGGRGQMVNLDDTKVVEEVHLENSPPDYPTDGFSVHRPSLGQILAPVHYDAELSFFKAIVAPLRLLKEPAAIWVILTYGCALSPQIILTCVIFPPSTRICLRGGLSANVNTVSLCLPSSKGLPISFPQSLSVSCKLPHLLALS